MRKSEVKVMNLKVCWQPCHFHSYLIQYIDESAYIMSETLDADCFTEEKQKARCFLRERFLRAVSNLVGKECTFHMHSNTALDGIFKGSDIEFKNILVDNLKTPIAQIPHSKLRSSDVNYISFHEIKGIN